MGTNAIAVMIGMSFLGPIFAVGLAMRSAIQLKRRMDPVPAFSDLVRVVVGAKRADGALAQFRTRLRVALVLSLSPLVVWTVAFVWVC